MTHDVKEAPVTRHFLDISDFSTKELRAILRAGEEIKARRRTPDAAGDRLLEGKVIAMIFEQPSLRTRVSFDVGIRELGGSPMMVTGQEIELGERETIADTARVLSRYVDAIMIRMLDHDSVVEMSKYATVPVINGLTKRQHPCQVMADVMTFEERKGPIKGKRIAWTGDTNNVLTSWVHAAGRLDFELAIATPEELAPPPALLDWARDQGARVKLTTRPEAAVEGADCVITDCWVSMGDEEGTRHNLLRPYQVDDRLLDRAEKDAIFMHCLPASRGEEVTDSVMDGPQSAVFDEAENRLHAQKGILAWCFGGVSA
ncbi:ornithine carbamoyltransferase [Bosea sp. OK403]|uniref:ornithine carbamoyltransferase n=1 Tax=Bosea sp. OK403 TaxID=1855286 RepID=UPI0008F339DB|nr:ornithine carbamoyltransferase [Bosea sp. OK403]SFJ17456.1 ornithine carbamoyltransferase [Bosea sp. OK403]